MIQRRRTLSRDFRYKVTPIIPFISQTSPQFPLQRIKKKEADLLVVTLEHAAGLGLQVVVAAETVSISFYDTIFTALLHGIWVCILPLNSPVQSSVGNDKGGNNVEDLSAETTERVEDGGVESTGEGALTVGGEDIGRDALGGRAAWKGRRSVSMGSICDWFVLSVQW